MRTFVALLFFAVFALAAGPAHAQTSGTTMAMQAKWDNGTAIQGSVTLALANLTGPDTVIVTQTLSKGKASVLVPLAANAIYHVTLSTSNGTQLIKFPITTALINPGNLSKAELDVVVHTADKSLASASMQVSMNF